jgi:aspartate/methionine/tyrosine aminotransferase
MYKHLSISSEKDDQFLRNVKVIFEQKLSTLLGALKTVKDISIVSPQKGWYVRVDVTKLMEKLGFGKDLDNFIKIVLDDTGVQFCVDKSSQFYPNKQFVGFDFSQFSSVEIHTSMHALKAWVEKRLEKPNNCCVF